MSVDMVTDPELSEINKLLNRQAKLYPHLVVLETGKQDPKLKL